MKTVVYFSDFTQDLVNERAWKEAVQRETGAGQVFAVMSGNYLQNGLPAAESAGISATASRPGPRPERARRSCST